MSQGATRQVFITGASGALGKALALHHANPAAEMRLWGRDAQRLAQSVKEVEQRGAKTQQTLIDMRDAEAAVDKLLKEDEAHRFDLAYLVAGVGDTRPPGAIVEDPGSILQIAQVNFSTTAAMAAALAGRMVERQQGRIVLIGSAAAHHSLPSAAAYAGSKAGLARFSDSLRLSVKPHGVSITLAAPGFIGTPATLAGSGIRPFELSVDKAAQRIARAGELRKRRYVTPWQFAALRTIDSLLPAAIRDRILTRLEP